MKIRIRKPDGTIVEFDDEGGNSGGVHPSVYQQPGQYHQPGEGSPGPGCDPSVYGQPGQYSR